MVFKERQVVSGVQKYMNKTVFLLWGSEKKSDEFQISKVKGYLSFVHLNISWSKITKIVDSPELGLVSIKLRLVYDL